LRCKVIAAATSAATSAELRAVAGSGRICRVSSQRRGSSGAQARRAPTDQEVTRIKEFEMTDQAFFSSPALREFVKGGAPPSLPEGTTDAEKRGRRFFEDVTDLGISNTARVRPATAVPCSTQRIRCSLPSPRCRCTRAFKACARRRRMRHAIRCTSTSSRTRQHHDPVCLTRPRSRIDHRCRQGVRPVRQRECLQDPDLVGRQPNGAILSRQLGTHARGSGCALQQVLRGCQ